MKNVYLWIVDNRVIYHTDLDAAAGLDGLARKPDMTVTDAEFESVGCMARVIDGDIVIGKTPGEIAEEDKRARIDAYMNDKDLQTAIYLTDLDYRLLLLEWGITA